MASAPSVVGLPLTAVTPPVTMTRKRRRRAPATGAADDCFACRKKGVKCDRRRPYCTPCLDLGKECSGYKTQLTWGVGVASRGKLRGLSLPIARKTNTSPTVTASRGRGSYSSASDSTSTSSPPREKTGQERPNTAKVSPPRNVMRYDFVNMDPTGSPVIPALHSSTYNCASSVPSDHSDAIKIPMEPSNAYPLLRQSFFSGFDMGYDTPLGSPLTEDFGLSSSGGSMAGFGSDFGDSDVSSPIDLPHTPEDYTLHSSPFSFYQSSPFQQPGRINQPRYAPVTRRAPTSFPDHYSSASSMSSSLSSDRSIFENMTENTHHSEPIGSCSLSDIVFDDGVTGGNMPMTNDIELGFGFVMPQDFMQSSTDSHANSYRLIRRDHIDAQSSPFLFDM